MSTHQGVLISAPIQDLFSELPASVVSFVWDIFWFINRCERVNHCVILTVCVSNKANLGDLIAATGLVISLKSDSNHRFSACATLEFDEWPRKIIGHLFYTTSRFVHLKSIGKFKLKLQSENAQFGSKSAIFFCPVWTWNSTDDLEKLYGTSSMLLQA